MKNGELTNQRKEGQTENSDFIGPSVHGGPIKKGNWTKSVFPIY